MSTEFCDFSLDHYREILESAKNSGYDFLLFDEVQTKATGRTCLLRHDIDYAPEKAMEFGQIEADLGIRSTYFFKLWRGHTIRVNAFAIKRFTNSKN